MPFLRETGTVIVSSTILVAASVWAVSGDRTVGAFAIIVTVLWCAVMNVNGCQLEREVDGQ